MPGGAQGELVPALKALKQAHPACSVVLGLREILDAPEVTQRVWETEGAYEALRRYYDRILSYGSKEMLSTCTTYRIPVPLRGTHYCGYVVKQDPVQGAEKIRQALRLPKRRYVFVSAGGGGDGQLLMRTYVQAVRILGSRVDFATLIAVGVISPPAIDLSFEGEGRRRSVLTYALVVDRTS